MEKFTCCLCHKNFEGIGNNPYPVVKEDGERCCDDCNALTVIPARMCEASADQTVDITRFAKMTDDEILSVLKGKEIVLFHSAKHNEYNDGVYGNLFCRGTITKVENKCIPAGELSSFPIDLVNDNYVIVTEK